jgi:hypothetical protein
MYISQEFKEAWKDWKLHKEERCGQPYTRISESKAMSRLFKITHGIEALAISSIEISIEKNWSNIYLQKAEDEQQSNDDKSQFRADVQAAFNDRYGQQR